MKLIWSQLILVSIIFFIASLVTMLLKRFRKPAAVAAIVFLGLGLISFYMVRSETIAERVFPESESETIKRTADLIGYEQLAREPTQYVGRAVTFEGRVVQVLDRGQFSDLRINVTKNPNGTWLNTIYVIYRRPSPKAPRILDGDIVRLYGEYRGITTYKNVMGQPVQVPHVAASAIERLVQ